MHMTARIRLRQLTLKGLAEHDAFRERVIEIRDRTFAQFRRHGTREKVSEYGFVVETDGSKDVFLGEVVKGAYESMGYDRGFTFNRGGGITLADVHSHKIAGGGSTGNVMAPSPADMLYWNIILDQCNLWARMDTERFRRYEPGVLGMVLFFLDEGQLGMTITRFTRPAYSPPLWEQAIEKFKRYSIEHFRNEPGAQTYASYFDKLPVVTAAYHHSPVDSLRIPRELSQKFPLYKRSKR